MNEEKQNTCKDVDIKDIELAYIICSVILGVCSFLCIILGVSLCIMELAPIGIVLIIFGLLFIFLYQQILRVVFGFFCDVKLIRYSIAKDKGEEIATELEEKISSKEWKALDNEDYVDITCPYCFEELAFLKENIEQDQLICPNCGKTIHTPKNNK